MRLIKHTGHEGLAACFLYKFYHVFPSPALPGSGSMGIISARYIKAPLNCRKGTLIVFQFKTIAFFMPATFSKLIT